MLTALKVGKKFTVLAKSNAYKLQILKSLGRNARKPARLIVLKSFQIGLPIKGKPLVAMVTLDNGDTVVLHVKSSKHGSLPKKNARVMQFHQRSFMSAHQTAVLSLVRNFVAQKSTIKRNMREVVPVDAR